MLNPFHLRGICKKVYTRMLIYIYFTYLNLTTDISQSEDYAQEDCDLDFNGEACLSFVDFYNGFFECVDYFTKSFLVSEYTRFVSILHEKLKASFWLNGLDLHNKLHVDSSRQQYMPWMISLMRVTQKRPLSLMNSPMKVRVSQRLLHKPEHIIDKSENKILEKRINKLSRMQSVPIKYIVLNRTNQIPEKSRKSRQTARSRPVQKKSMKFRRNSQVLEDIIEKRKPQYFNKTQEIFFNFYDTV